MKEQVRLVVLSVFLLAALAFSAVGVMAMEPTQGQGVMASTASPSATVSPTPASNNNEVVGTISAIDSSSITINGIVYMLATNAEIQGSFQVGDMVKLEFFVDANGNLVAYEVSVPESSGTGIEPTGTAEPTEVEPTETAISTEPVSTESFDTPEPTKTMEPVSTEESFGTPAPVSTEPVSTESFVPDQHPNGSGSNPGNQNPGSGGSGNSGN